MTKGVWEELSPDATPEDRVARLERVTQGYHDVIGEGGMLADAVGNLDVSAGSIAAVLRRVESNQTQLIQVAAAGQKTRGMVHAAEEDRVAEKKRLRLIGFFIASTLFVIVLASTVGIISYVRAVAEADARYHQVSADICGRRNAQATVMQSYLDTQVRQINAMKKLTATQRDTYLKETAQLRGAFPVVDCAKLVQTP